MRIVYACGALAAGEYLAAQFPVFAEAWPLVALAAVWAVLFGYGLAWRGWHLLALFLAGMALFLLASVESERQYRHTPWLRDSRRAGHAMRRRAASRPGPTTAAIRADLSRRVAIGLAHDPEVVALNRAILLGERDKLPWGMKLLFIESGAMHVFAISGLHVMAVAKVLVVLLALLCVPRRWAGVVAIPILWGYVHLIGWSPSAVRAAMMASFYYVAPVFWRRPSGLRAWALTFLVVHVRDPLLIVDVGCSLSFLVMLAIMLAGSCCRACGPVCSLLLVTVVGWAVGVPISAHAFGRVTPGGILSNLVLIVAAGCTVVSGIVGLLASFLSDAVAAHFNNLSALFTRAMVGVSEVVSRLPGSNFEVANWPIRWCVAWYGALIVAVFAVRLAVRFVRAYRTRKGDMI